MFLLLTSVFAFITFVSGRVITVEVIDPDYGLTKIEEPLVTGSGNFVLTPHELTFNDTEEDWTFPIPKRSVEGSFFHACVAAISVIVVSEIGDKTFFIAVILSMNHSRMVVFCGALSALIFMTALSVGLGQVSNVIPRIYVHYVSIALFVIFGLKMLKDGYSMSSTTAKSEYNEAQKTIETRESKIKEDVSLTEAGLNKKHGVYILAWIFIEAFTMTFLAEWGDRSQLTTIVLAARENALGVILGAVLGHAACTLLAVLGGRFVAERISVKAVTIIGGIIFLAFALWATLAGPGEDAPPVDFTTENPLLLTTSFNPIKPITIPLS